MVGVNLYMRKNNALTVRHILCTRGREKSIAPFSASGNQMKKLCLIIIISLYCLPVYAWAETPHDTYQNLKMDSHLEVASEKHTEVIERLATIETRVTAGVAIGMIILGGLILPWVRKRMRLAVLILVLVGSLSCSTAPVPLIVSGGCGPCNQQRCFTEAECTGEGVCYCSELGYCVDAFP